MEASWLAKEVALADGRTEGRTIGRRWLRTCGGGGGVDLTLSKSP